jgi:hypothetical protein
MCSVRENGSKQAKWPQSRSYGFKTAAILAVPAGGTSRIFRSKTAPACSSPAPGPAAGQADLSAAAGPAAGDPPQFMAPTRVQVLPSLRPRNCGWFLCVRAPRWSSGTPQDRRDATDTEGKLAQSTRPAADAAVLILPRSAAVSSRPAAADPRVPTKFRGATRCGWPGRNSRAPQNANCCGRGVADCAGRAVRFKFAAFS